MFTSGYDHNIGLVTYWSRGELELEGEISVLPPYCMY